MLGFVDGVTHEAKPPGRKPLVIHPEVVHRDVAVDLRLRWTTAAGSPPGDWVVRAAPDSGQVRLPTGRPRRCGGCNRRRRRVVWRDRPLRRLNRRLDRRLHACRNGHHDIHLSRFRQRRRDVANDSTVLLLNHPAGVHGFGRIERIVPVLVVAVRELVGARAVLHHDTLGHELFVKRGGRGGLGDARDRVCQHRLVAGPCDRRLADRHHIGCELLRSRRHRWWVRCSSECGLERTLRA